MRLPRRFVAAIGVVASLAAALFAGPAEEPLTLPSPEIRLLAVPATPTMVSSPYPCNYGWAGGGFWYCEYSDPALHLHTWVRGDGVASLRVCALPERYGQTIPLRLVWTPLLARGEPLPVEGEPDILFSPTAAEPCLTLERTVELPTLSDGLLGPDLRRTTPYVPARPTWRVYMPLIAAR